jgi:(2Fe-2S) ferredoxin
MAFYRSHVLVCVDPECLSNGAHDIIDALQDEFVAQGLIDEIQVLETSRIGKCGDGTEMMVYPEGVHYHGMSVDDIPYLVEEHFLKGRIVERFHKVVKPVVDEELGPPRPKEALS